jgi:hypothetical protein
LIGRKGQDPMSTLRTCVRLLILVTLPTLAAAAQPVSTQSLTPQQRQALDIYRELLEINTTASSGDTYEAAKAMAARLIGAGFPEADVRALQSGPKRGNLVARLRGTGKRKPILLVAHIDVVEAKRSDWTTDPFKLVEKEGYFYARGSGDDKYMAATWISNLIRYKKEGYRPDRDLIVALETDEEGGNPEGLGIGWLIDKHRDLIDAEFALNEGGSVAVKASGWRRATAVDTAPNRVRTTRSMSSPRAWSGSQSSISPCGSTKPLDSTSSACQKSRPDRWQRICKPFSLRSRTPRRSRASPPRCRITRSCARPASRRASKADTRTTHCRKSLEP